MRVLLSTYGTRGDVQPFVALARALKRRGHEVAVCTPTGFREMVERHGVAYAHMDNAVLELTEAVLRATTWSEQRRLFKGFGAIIRAGLEDEWRAARAQGFPAGQGVWNGRRAELGHRGRAGPGAVRSARRRTRPTSRRSSRQ